MELYLTIILMLILIIAGAVAFCAVVAKKARRASENTDVAFEALARFEVRLEDAERQITLLGEKEPERANESEERRVTERNRQIEALMEYQISDYGLKFEGGGE